MSEVLHVEWHNTDQANASFKAMVAPFVRMKLDAGQHLQVDIKPIEDDRTLKQNRFLFGFVYKHICEQAQVNGIGATADGWHLYYKRMFLGYRFTKTVLPGKRRPSITRELRSTTSLKVKAMSNYLDQVMAHAASVFLVTFPADISWQTYEGGRVNYAMPVIN